MTDFDVQQVARDAAIETWDTDEPSEGQVDTMVLGIAVIVPAVTQQIRTLHRETGLVIWYRDALGDDHQDQISHCALCGDDWPCPTIRLLDQLDAAARGEGS